ncbi:hypothetical protein M2454_002847, partial [Aequitasia blattaphilus]|uniref:hypothetical protein n=1 Tax=Aequitasia blattaphilus TaxID=2949332 RepID=UPI003D247681
TITGVPKKLVYGDADFTLGAKGGNGSGALSYTLESGDGISIKGNKVSILKAGTAVIKVTKAADDTYNETSEVIRITIDKAEPVIQKSPSINGAKAGKTLQELSLEKLKAYGVDGKALTGSFAWKSAETVVSKGGKYTAVFTPNDKNYKSVNFEVQVNLDSTKPADSQKGNETSKKASSPNTADESSPFLYLTLLLTGLLGILGSKKLDIRR